jgi:hypothetical protein
MYQQVGVKGAGTSQVDVTWLDSLHIMHSNDSDYTDATVSTLGGLVGGHGTHRGPQR